MYIAIDGDDIGREIEKLIVQGTDEEISALSQRVAVAVGVVVRSIEKHRGRVIMQGGDSVLAEVHELPPSEVERMLLLGLPDFSFSAGIGQTVPSAFMALKLAKAMGKCRCIDWSSDSGILL